VDEVGIELDLTIESVLEESWICFSVLAGAREMSV